MSMGDLTDGDRGVGRQADPFDDDPFAELARLIDAPEAQRSSAMKPEPVETWQFDLPSDTGADADFDLDMDAFAGALDEELARETSDTVMGAVPVAAIASPLPKAAASYSNWISPAPRAPAPTASKSAPVSSASPATADDSVSDPVLEAAFRGLSAPANPRDAKFQVSEAFAPARTQDASVAEPTAQLFDDFDALIASELAAMQKPLQAAPSEGRNHAFAGDDTAARNEPAPEHDDLSPSAPEARQTAHAARRQAVSGRRAGLAAASTVASASTRQLPISRRMMSVGASLLVIALIGGAGAYMLTGNGGKVYDAPLIVQADSEPVKVAPKDPGGRAIPNQNKAVYERVQSASAAIEPSQQTLLTAAEEPAELPQPEPEPAFSDLPGVDLNPIGTALAAEPVRVADAGGDDSPIAVLTPRRVRTLTVNPDGTLVASEQVPSTSLQELRAQNPALIDAASRPLDSLATGTTPSQEQSASAESDSASGVPMPSMKPGTEAAAAMRVAAVTPAEPQPDPVLTQEAPATPPVAVAPEPEPAATEVAALPAATPPAVEGGYYVQISSQPSREAAEDSSRTLGQRFSEVIGGRSLVIQSADIPGKGTYHRVRVATGSKSEANDLCQRLKSAGGSCFVSR